MGGCFFAVIAAEYLCAIITTLPLFVPPFRQRETKRFLFRRRLTQQSNFHNVFDVMFRLGPPF